MFKASLNMNLAEETEWKREQKTDRGGESIQIEAKWGRAKICVQVSLTPFSADCHPPSEDNHC